MGQFQPKITNVFEAIEDNLKTLEESIKSEIISTENSDISRDYNNPCNIDYN